MAEEKVTRVHLDLMERLEPRGLVGWRVGLGLRDPKVTQDYPEPEDPLETRGCRASLVLKANPVCLG